jgi:NAD(P)-dependent dehydrogenase (short-subunit alcohol dehydrogenase family)
MARIFITGSADGLGRLAAQSLLAGGHEVIVHARSASRAAALDGLVAGGARAVVGDLTVRDDVLGLADEVDALGPLQAVVHNAGVYRGPAIFPVNVVAPYVLTARMRRPQRLIYLSSGLHEGGDPSFANADWSGRTASVTYATSKLFVTTLAAAVARLWPDVVTSAVDPDWVPTKMGGPGATGDLSLGHLTQEWLATSDDPAALASGGYWYHQRTRDPHPAVRDIAFQDALLAALHRHTGVPLDTTPPRTPPG